MDTDECFEPLRRVIAELLNHRRWGPEDRAELVSVDARAAVLVDAYGSPGDPRDDPARLISMVQAQDRLAERVEVVLAGH